MSDLIQKWHGVPRAGRWLAYLVVFVAIFYFALLPYIKGLSQYSSRAEKLERALSRERELASDSTPDGAVINSARLAFGPPLMPAGSKLRPEEFARVVDGVLEFHGITDRNVTERRVRAPSDQFGGLGAGDIDRLIVEVTFEARPDVVVAILSDLEKAPQVAAVSRVRIDRSSIRDEDSQLVRATLTPEAWIPATSSSAPPPPSEVSP